MVIFGGRCSGVKYPEGQISYIFRFQSSRYCPFVRTLNPGDRGQRCPLLSSAGQTGHALLADCRARADYIYLAPL